jgi:hypothetical protein
MIIKKCLSIFIMVSVALSIPSLLGCDIGSSVNKITRAIDNAIDALNQNSSEWQGIMNRLLAQLQGIDDQLAELIEVEVQNLLDRGVAVIGTEFRCNVDFIGNRMRDALLRIKEEYLHQNVAVDPLKPYICEVVPSSVDRILIPDRLDMLEFFGYDFDLEDVKLYIENNEGLRTNVSQYLVKPTHYHMTVSLGLDGVMLTSRSNKFVLTCGFEDLSYVKIIQESTDIDTILPGKRTFVPPHTRGDQDFNGNGPEVFCRVELSILNYDTQVWAEIYMRARQTTHDWTTAEGTDSFLLYTAPVGKEIKQILCPTYDQISYLDSNTSQDVFERGVGGPVLRYKFTGDTEGNEAGTETKVIVEFTPIQVELEAP